MKERYFPARPELDAGLNIRRLYAYIRSINPNYQPEGRFARKIAAKKTAKLLRVK